jgi:hypothetical protein
MLGVGEDSRPRFWVPQAAADVSTAETKWEFMSCPTCGTEFLSGARFCHSCGAPRFLPGTAQPYAAVHEQEANPAFELGPVLALVAGVVCISGAIFGNFFFAGQSAADWEALQYWRIDCLLSSIAAFTAGILLRRR